MSANVLNYLAQNTNGDNELVIGGTITITGTINVDAGSLVDTANTLTLGKTTNQLILGTTNTTTINSVAPAASRTQQISDVGANGYFAILGASPTTTINSTPAEIDLQCDVSAQTETVAAAGALSVTKRISNIALVGAGAVTLAAPSATMLGMVKIIQMTADNGDVTLALTNVQGQSSGTTATFNDVGDTLVLVGGASKWTVIGEAGITLS